MIYCVEDERNIRELIVYTLESSGFTARGLESGKELTEIYVLTYGHVALSVPALTGYTMFRWLFEFCQHPDGVGV